MNQTKTKQPCQVTFPDGTTARKAAAIYELAYSDQYSVQQSRFLDKFRHCVATGRDVWIQIHDHPQVAYALAYMAIRKWGNVNFMVAGDGACDLRVHLSESRFKGEHLDYTLKDRVYFRTPMTDEQIDRRMARMHRILFPDVVIATTPEDVRAIDSTGRETIAASSEQPSTPSAKQPAKPSPEQPPKPPADQPPNPPSTAAVSATPTKTVTDAAKESTSCCPRSITKAVSAWILVSMLLYPLAMVLHAYGYWTLE